MIYTKDQIKKYLGILGDYNNICSEEVNLKAKCCACENRESFILGNPIGWLHECAKSR